MFQNFVHKSEKFKQKSRLTDFWIIKKAKSKF